MIKKNLIFFMSDFSSGGAGNSISKLCLNLPPQEYKMSVISLGKCAYSDYKEKYTWERRAEAILSLFD